MKCSTKKSKSLHSPEKHITGFEVYVHLRRDVEVYVHPKSAEVYVHPEPAEVYVHPKPAVAYVHPKPAVLYVQPKDDKV